MVVNLSFTAKFFGVSIDRDNWVLALNCLLVIDLIIWGPINETFRAKFVLLKETIGQSEVFVKVRALLLVSLLTSVCIVGFMLLFPDLLASVIAPKIGGVQFKALVYMIMLLVPSLLINQLTLIGTSILNAYEIFALPEISGILSSLINLVFIFTLAPYIGIYSLVISYYLGLLLLLAMLVYQLQKKKIPIFNGYKKIKLSAFYPFFQYALPFFLPYFFIQINLLVEKSLASMLGQGMVSIQDYSRKFIDIPNNVLTSVLLTILVPALSSNHAKEDNAGFISSFQQIYRFGILVVALLIAFMSVSGNQLITLLLFHKGTISNGDITHITQLTQYYSWTAIVHFFYIMYGLALLSSNRGKIYAFFGVMAQIIMIVINICFYARLGLYTFPTSFIIAHTCSAIFMFVYFPGPHKPLYIITLKYLLLLALLVLSSVFFVHVLSSLFKTLNNYGVIISSTIIIIATLIAFIYLFRLDERFVISRFALYVTSQQNKSNCKIGKE
ncbi:Peptidoglycan biosynthesis protein MviN/MurJ, putative lipid II flippase [bacterium A37T11]|nr:Peptidoglycan biosynthesis protein MviN/MurJ, putative lipid II flippase [bacterium A37T11]